MKGYPSTVQFCKPSKSTHFRHNGLKYPGIGITTNALTVNDPAIMQKLIGLGIDFITTDEPVKALELLAK